MCRKPNCSAEIFTIAAFIVNQPIKSTKREAYREKIGAELFLSEGRTSIRQYIIQFTHRLFETKNGFQVAFANLAIVSGPVRFGDLPACIDDGLRVRYAGIVDRERDPSIYEWTGGAFDRVNLIGVNCRLPNHGTNDFLEIGDMRCKIPIRNGICARLCALKRIAIDSPINPAGSVSQFGQLFPGTGPAKIEVAEMQFVQQSHNRVFEAAGGFVEARALRCQVGRFARCRRDSPACFDQSLRVRQVGPGQTARMRGGQRLKGEEKDSEQGGKDRSMHGISHGRPSEQWILRFGSTIKKRGELMACIASAARNSAARSPSA